MGKKGGAEMASTVDGGGDAGVVASEGAAGKEKKNGKSLFKRLGGKKKDKA